MENIIWLYVLQYTSWIVSYTVQRSIGTAMATDMEVKQTELENESK